MWECGVKAGIGHCVRDPLGRVHSNYIREYDSGLLSATVFTLPELLPNVRTR